MYYNVWLVLRYPPGPLSLIFLECSVSPQAGLANNLFARPRVPFLACNDTQRASQQQGSVIPPILASFSSIIRASAKSHYWSLWVFWRLSPPTPPPPSGGFGLASVPVCLFAARQDGAKIEITNISFLKYFHASNRSLSDYDNYFPPSC